MPRLCQNVAVFKVGVMIVSLRHGEALVANKAEKPKQSLFHGMLHSLKCNLEPQNKDLELYKWIQLNMLFVLTLYNDTPLYSLVL